MTEKRPFLYTLKFSIIALLTAIIIFALAFAFYGINDRKQADSSLPTITEIDKIRFVIDAGHGGEDAGAIADDGTLEKDLSLEISKILSSILELNGSSVALTRNDDRLLYDHYNDLEDYTGKKKVYDLKNRLKIAEEEENSIYVGIHLNKFPQGKYSGLQVYYSKNNDLSYEIATSIKDVVKESLQPENKRQVKADSSIYILANAKIPAVLIECGFLSNEKELNNLKTEDYRKALALCIFSGIVKFES